ncbi:short chain dehydrogenase/reductase [Elsinoe ampelina]|uniref:Short chain dehydrogenase/reductase n=1 Tax=Elsinoe ampelina TaxID=302913 RepID=A0A6A6G4N9_9PEZI|nr:short chain dehydrogenase/reductase [Elsinoe ampelina]
MAPTAVFRAGANALITGGASGVGLAVAKLCASHDMNVLLVDVNKTKLEEAKSAISSSSKGSVSVHELDVSNESAWKSLRQSLQKSSTTLDLLHLNAGIGANASWTDTSYFHKIFDTNFFGVINGISTFLPDFQGEQSEQKSIVITGSKQGITNPPGNPAYNASKSAIKTIAEHLSFDLSKSSPKTSVHLLVPGWTFTGLTGGGKTTTKPDGAWAPEQVADYLYQKMSDGKFYVICPDNDVDWETDRKRMTWAMGDIVYERQALSRWRDDSKDESKKGIENLRL